MKRAAFVGAFAVDDAAHLHFAFFGFRHGPLVCDDADRPAVDPRISRDQRFPIAGFVLVELACVDDACENLIHVIRFRAVDRHQLVDFACRKRRRLRRDPVERSAWSRAEFFNNAPDRLQAGLHHPASGNR